MTRRVHRTWGVVAGVLLAATSAHALSGAANESAVRNGSIRVSCTENTLFGCLAGRSGGQTLSGGTAASENLTLQSTTNATKGIVSIPDLADFNDRIAVGNDATVTESNDRSIIRAEHAFLHSDFYTHGLTLTPQWNEGGTAFSPTACGGGSCAYMTGIDMWSVWAPDTTAHTLIGQYGLVARLGVIPGGTTTAATVTNAQGLYVPTPNFGVSGSKTVAVNTYIGALIDPFTATTDCTVSSGTLCLASGSTLTNLYGLKIGDQSVGGTLNYSLYTGKGLARIGDRLDLGDDLGNIAASTTNVLDVAPTLSLTGAGTFTGVSVAPTLTANAAATNNNIGVNVLGTITTSNASDVLVGVALNHAPTYQSSVANAAPVSYALVMNDNLRVTSTATSGTATVGDAATVYHDPVFTMNGTGGTMTIAKDVGLEVAGTYTRTAGTLNGYRKGLLFNAGTYNSAPTIVENIAVDVADQTTGTTQAALRSVMSSGAGKYTLLSTGTAISQHYGDFLVGGGTTAGKLKLLEPSASGPNFSAFVAQAQSADVTYTLPAAVASAGQVLTDAAGTGTLSWSAPGGVGWFDVRAYGAKGDGSTDDTAAIQAAITAAQAVNGVVWVPPANNGASYLITGTPALTITAPISLWFANRNDPEGSRPVFAYTSAGTALRIGAQATAMEGVDLRNVSIKNTGGTGVIGIDFDNVARATVDDVRVNNFTTGTGIRLTNAAGTGGVENNHFRWGHLSQNLVGIQITGTGAGVNRVNNTRLEGMLVYCYNTGTRLGVDIVQGGATKIIGGTIQGCTTGIQLNGDDGSASNKYGLIDGVKFENDTTCIDNTSSGTGLQSWDVVNNSCTSGDTDSVKGFWGVENYFAGNRFAPTPIATGGIIWAPGTRQTDTPPRCNQRSGGSMYFDGSLQQECVCIAEEGTGNGNWCLLANPLACGNITDCNTIGSAAYTVAQGGTGRATGTTAYSLVATGTTATGAQQTLANGATTEILVGGGAAALPVWTTAQGSGAPVRATSPTLVTPALGTPSAIVLTNATGLPLSGLAASARASGDLFNHANLGGL